MALPYMTVERIKNLVAGRCKERGIDQECASYGIDYTESRLSKGAIGVKDIAAAMNKGVQIAAGRQRLKNFRERGSIAI